MCLLPGYMCQDVDLPASRRGSAFLPTVQDLPASISQLSHFAGKAALPTHALGVSSFSKAFFLHPETEVGWGWHCVAWDAGWVGHVC